MNIFVYRSFVYKIMNVYEVITPMIREGRRKEVEEMFKNEPIKRVGEKVGRNSPCPCGSGIKYKKCCG